MNFQKWALFSGSPGICIYIVGIAKPSYSPAKCKGFFMAISTPLSPKASCYHLAHFLVTAWTCDAYIPRNIEATSPPLGTGFDISFDESAITTTCRTVSAREPMTTNLPSYTPPNICFSLASPPSRILL